MSSSEPKFDQPEGQLNDQPQGQPEKVNPIPTKAKEDGLAPAENGFIFVVCQNGAESAAKKEIATAHPNLRLAFSRPGFITFKVDPANPLPNRFTLRSTLARTYGWSIGKVSGLEAGQMAEEVIANAKLAACQHVHVWQRDPSLPGQKGFEPGVSALAKEVGNTISEKLAESDRKLPVNHVAKADELIFDVVMVEPGEWWLGYHAATTMAGRWPGGTPLVDTSIEMASRAYLKAREALLWSGIKIHPGDQCAEIGSSPGGCCQLLLELGAKVIGIDPAEMEPELLKDENFTHLRRRGHEVKKRDLKDVKWLFADMSMVPNYTLDTVSEIVSHPSVDVKGIVLTLKLTDWKLVDDIPGLLKRVRELGFSVVKSRQLAFNRREFCLVAVKDKFVLRSGKQKPGKQKPSKKKPGKKKKTPAKGGD